MFEALFALLLGLAFLTTVGHGIWLLCAAVIRAIRGGAHGASSAAPSKTKLRDQCPVCTTQFLVPSARCDVCGWPERTPAPADRKRIALDALRRIAQRFRRTEWLDVESFQAVRERLAEAKIELEEAELRMEPTTKMELTHEQAVQVMRVIEQLEELDDVQNVYSNLLITDEVMAAYEAAE